MKLGSQQLFDFSLACVSITSPKASPMTEVGCTVFVQVTSEAKFVDLGADSLDTVRSPFAL